MRQTIRRVARPALTRYRQSSVKWRLDNLVPTARYWAGHHPLTPVQKSVLDRLNRDGIAITSAAELLGDDAAFDDMKAEVNRLEDEQSGSLAEARRRADEVQKSKSFIYNLLGERPRLDPQSPFVRFALHPGVLDVANSYFRMFVHLRFFNVWHTFTTQSGATRSQLWHQDPEDRLILKVFAYLSDVDEGAGPLTYAPGTHLKGKVAAVPDHFFESTSKARRSTDEQMENVVPSSRWISAVGPPGTVIFADTRGYHKGGFATERERIMYNCLFTSPTSSAIEMFERDSTINLADRAQEFAVAGSRSSN